MSSLSIFTGRFLLGLYFFVPGLSKFLAPESQIALMDAQGIPFAHLLLAFAGAASLIGGLALMSGRHIKLAAYGFVVYVILVNVLIHPFWTIPGELQNFIKNLGILGGLLVLAGYAKPRTISPKGWWKSDGAV